MASSGLEGEEGKREDEDTGSTSFYYCNSSLNSTKTHVDRQDRVICALESHGGSFTCRWTFAQPISVRRGKLYIFQPYSNASSDYLVAKTSSENDILYYNSRSLL
jgi:hypothetical protein